MEKMIGLTHAELREQSHDPKRFFGVKAMVLPDYTMGKDFALLNQLRTAVRRDRGGCGGGLPRWRQIYPGRYHRGA